MKRKGLIILGPQGSGKTTLVQSIAAMYKKSQVIEIFDPVEIKSLASDKKLIILDGLPKLPSLSGFRMLYAREAKYHKFIIVANNISKNDIPLDVFEVFNVIELK